MTEIRTEFQLKSPEDGISSVNFAPNSLEFLLVSSWDKSVRLYNVVQNTVPTKYSHSAAVLDTCFQDIMHSCSGGLDKTLKMYDFNTNIETTVGYHDAPIRCVEYSDEISAIATGSWDSTVKLWDPRSPKCVGTIPQPGKVYALSLTGEKMVVGMNGLKVYVWDLRSLGYPQQRRESSLKYQTRCIKSFPNKQGYVLGSIEGRAAVEYFDLCPKVQKQKYTFQCHRIQKGSFEEIYPVNAISFQSENTFATGGSDGYVSIWNVVNKKKLQTYPRYPTSITSLSFSHDNSMLAIASSYMYEHEETPEKIPEDNIYIRNVKDLQTKPK